MPRHNFQAPQRPELPCSGITASTSVWTNRRHSGPDARGANPDSLQPSKEELAHDFLWRAHLRTPGKGEVVIFNRSHYEDVLVVRVHNLVPKSVWSKRYDLINEFERNLVEPDTQILK